MEGNNRGETYVIDASAVLAVLLPDEKHLKTSKQIVSLFDELQNFFVAPHLLKYEVPNGLRTAHVRKRINLSVFRKLQDGFNELPIVYRDVDSSKIAELAHKKNLTVYDAAYLQVAKDESAKLLALDKDLLPFSELL